MRKKIFMPLRELRKSCRITTEEMATRLGKTSDFALGIGADVSGITLSAKNRGNVQCQHRFFIKLQTRNRENSE